MNLSSSSLGPVATASKQSRQEQVKDGIFIQEVFGHRLSQKLFVVV